MSRILENLRLILEHTHNAYMFQARCRAHKVIIERLLDGSIVAYRSDDRDDRITVDTDRALLRF